MLILDHNFHLQFSQIACLGTKVTQMKLDEFYFLQERIRSGISLKQAILSLADSPFTRVIKDGPELIQSAEAAVEICLKKDFKMIYPGHELYPEIFLNIDEPPKLLTYRGLPAWLTANKISVVGSRDLMKDAVDWMELYFNNYLRESGATTVSGAAFGVDQLAHRISVRNRLPTIAFLPSGLAKVYPYRFSYDIEAILDARGAVVSEFLPDTEMDRSHFERRNRLISGISETLFVVQARRKSGSMITARLALGQGKTICVLVSSPTQSQNLGNLDLLFDGAHPLRDEKDLLAITGS